MDLPLWKALVWPQGSPLVCPLFFCARRRPEGHHAPLQQFAQQWLREVPRIVMADTREQGGLCAVNGVEVLRRAVGSGKNQAHNHPNDTHCRAFLDTSALSDGAHTGAHHLGTALVRPQHASHNVVAAARAGKKTVCRRSPPSPAFLHVQATGETTGHAWPCVLTGRCATTATQISLL